MLHVTKFFKATYDNPHQKAKLSDRRLTCWLQGLFIYPSVQQDGVALPLRQQRPFAQPTDGDDSDDRRATGIDAFSFTRHTACSFGDAPTGQNAAACRLTVSSTAMMDGVRTQCSAFAIHHLPFLKRIGLKFSEESCNPI